MSWRRRALPITMIALSAIRPTAASDFGRPASPDEIALWVRRYRASHHRRRAGGGYRVNRRSTSGGQIGGTIALPPY